MKTLLTLTLVLFLTPSFAQVFPVQVSLQITPPYSPYLSDYTAPGSQSFAIHIYTNDITLADYRARLRLTIEGPGITLRTQAAFVPRPLHLQGGVPQTFYGEDLQEYFHPDNLTVSGLPFNEYAKNGRLPDGIYRFSIEVLDYNRGTVVSNKGTAMAWVILNDPPILILPSNFSKLKIQDPLNVLFSWTPRHTGSPNAAFSTEYIFRLVELWPEQRHPNDAFLTTPPLYETTTTENQLHFGPNEPRLLPGRKYAWQVQAHVSQGKDLFKNKGYSEVFVFQYGEALAVPANLRMRWAKPTTLAIKWDPLKDSDPQLRYRLQYRPRLRRENHEWYETWTRFTDKTLYNLQTNTEYEMRIRSENGLQDSEYSGIQVFTTLREEQATFACRDNAPPPPVPASTLPVFPLSVNDTIHAGGYDVLVRDVMRAGTKYFGSGLAIVPWFNGAKVRVTFENIGVNDRFWLTSGAIKSVWNRESSSLWEEQTPVTAGSVPETGNLDITVVESDSLVSMGEAIIASVTKDETGNIIVTTTAGETVTLARGESYALADGAGNGYVIDEKGNIAKTTSTAATETATRGNRNYRIALQFVPEGSEFGFDEKRFDGLESYYQRLEDGTHVPWKALSTSRPDLLGVTVRSGDIDIGRVTFEAGAAPVIATVAPTSSATLSLQGKVAGIEEELLASYRISDTIPPIVVGKVNLATYDPIYYNLEIVPVNGATLPGGIDGQSIARELNSIYRKAVVAWNVSVTAPLQVPLGRTFDPGDTGLLSNYSQDMKSVLRAYGSLRDNTYYLFVIEEPSNPSLLGYMPRGRQAGFVFVRPHQGNGREFLKTIAHELGHGAFNLQHTFREHSLPAGSTDNVMDYSDGTALYKYQWDYIHKPRMVVGLFEGGEEGEMNFELAAIETELLKRVRSQSVSSDCWSEGVSRAYTLRKRFGMEIALYGGFLKYLACETEQENCGRSNTLSPFACGMTNALLNELDWITMLESVEGWSIDPEEILNCMINSFPIGGRPNDDLKIESVMFKCLVGIDLEGLMEALEGFIAENWDEPYYQGQATAYAITLLSPFKSKVLSKIGKLPQYSGKLEKLSLLAKAANKEELAGVAKLNAKLVDEDQIQGLHTVSQVLQGPILPTKIASSFNNSIYTNRKLINSERFFKYHGIDNRTGKKYIWLTNKKYPSEKTLRNNLAIREDWGVEIKYVSEFDVPAGTWVSEGTAASQGIGYPGGDYQAIILNIPKTWTVKTVDAF